MDCSKDNQAAVSSSSSSSSDDKKQTKSDSSTSGSNSSSKKVDDSEKRVLKEALKCPICFDLLASPCLFPKCGHMFCCKCAHTLNSPCCPVCRESSEELSLVRVFNMDAITAEEAVRLWGENVDENGEASQNNNSESTTDNPEYKSWILRRDEGLALVASAMKLNRKVPTYDEGEGEDDSSDNDIHDSDDDDSDDECDCDDDHMDLFAGFRSSRDNTPKSYFSKFETGSSLGGTDMVANIAELSVEEKAELAATVRKRRFAAYNDKNTSTSSSSSASIKEVIKEGDNQVADRESLGSKKMIKTSTTDFSEVEGVGCQSSSPSSSSSSSSAILTTSGKNDIVSAPMANLTLEQKQRAKDMERIKREKIAQKDERDRLRAEIARDREDRRLNKGILSVGHALGGVRGATVKAATETLINASSSDGQDIDEKITAAIELIMKTRVEDAVPAMSLILSILNNIIAHPDESKYRTINASGKIFKERADHVIGIKALLNSLGFKNIPLPPVEGVSPSTSDNQSRLTLPQGDIKLIEDSIIKMTNVLSLKKK